MAGSHTLLIDPDGFEAAERLAAYEMANTLLRMNLRLQSALGMRPEEFQVFLVIVLGTTQRFVRSAAPAPEFLTRAPLPAALAGYVSRRRIADVLGVPLETVRRHVRRLLSCGLVVERRRGRLTTPGGTLKRLAGHGVPAGLLGDVAALVNALLRQGALTTAKDATPARTDRDRELGITRPRSTPPASRGRA